MDNTDTAVAKRRADLMNSGFGLPREVIEVRAEVRAFAEKVLRPCSMELNTRVESRDAFPRQILQAMAEAGIFTIPFPADVGGRGLANPTLALVVALEEIGYFSPGIASALGDGQLILVGQTLNRASQDLRERYLPLIVGGKIVCSFATSEPAASTDLSPDSMKTVATKVEGGWRINGRKRWITNAVAADIILVLCKTGERSQSMILVETRDNGVTVYDPDLKMGNHPQLTSDVLFENSFAPNDNVVGAVDSGLRAALGALTAGRVGIGAIGVGMAQAALDLACDHMERRSVFGKELARYQHWQFTFADHAIAIEQARLLYYKAAAMLDGGHWAEVESAMAKVAGSRLAVDVARDAVQVCGAYGFVKQLSATGERRAVEAIYRDSKIGEIYEGANEVQKWIIARRIFGRLLTG